MLKLIAPGFCLERAAENERRAAECEDERQRAAWLQAAAEWRRNAHGAALHLPATDPAPEA